MNIDATSIVKLNPNEVAVLCALTAEGNEREPYAYAFKTLAQWSGVLHVRRWTRSLARKGPAEYRRGLFNDDGEVAGSGYSATAAGWAWMRTYTGVIPSGCKRD